MFMTCFNELPHDDIYDKSKAYADDKINVSKN